MRTAPVRITQNIVLAAVAVIGALAIVFVAVALVMGLRPADVVSGSMRPTLPVGSIVLTKEVPASTLKVGDIVQLPRQDTDGVVTHRIQHIAAASNGTYRLTLKGDANKLADPQPYTVRTAGLYKGDIPVLGAVAEWVKTYPVYAVAIMLGTLTFAFWGRSTVAVAMPDGSTIDGLSRKEAERIIAVYRGAPQH
ncbi:signal peptidase I [Gryllotalpicola reticulitermitis]|uniref:Signal peptidase I n=1 Tax=Gryllotalpicola reticulitermitis TaxID=1184153 RepID=A0ABV8Q712_9MICO